MSALAHITPTPFEPLTRYPSRIEFPSFQSLFFDRERDDARPKFKITKDAKADIIDDSDDSDSDTIVMSTPKARPRTLSLENLPDSFDLDSIDADEDEESDDNNKGSSYQIGTTRSVLAELSVQVQGSRRMLEEEEEEEGEEERSDEDSDSSSESDISDDSDDEGEDAIINTLLSHEEMLGSTFVYGEEARSSDELKDSRWHMLGSIYDTVQKPSDTYAAAMRIFSIVARMTEEEEDDYKQAELFEEVKELVWNGAMAWLELPDPEEEMTLGLAKFALMGQLTRLFIFDEDIVCRVIEEFNDQLHIGGRMRVLQLLIRYAGPIICNIKTADALETVREACEARPRDCMMQWMHSKIKKDMLVHAYRIMCVGQEHDRRVEAEELLKVALILKEADMLPTQYP